MCDYGKACSVCAVYKLFDEFTREFAEDGNIVKLVFGKVCRECLNASKK